MVKSDAAAVSNRNIVPSSHPCMRMCVCDQLDDSRNCAVATTKRRTDDWNAKGKDSTPPPQIVDTKLNTAQHCHRVTHTAHNGILHNALQIWHMRPHPMF
jgi:hypothetical protein